MSFFYELAYAADAGAAAPQSGMGSIIMLLMFGLIVYFMIIRPQQKRVKEHKQMTEELSKGDEIVTNGGVVGKIVKVSDNFVLVNVSENVDLTLQKGAISSVLPKGTIKSIQ